MKSKIMEKVQKIFVAQLQKIIDEYEASAKDADDKELTACYRDDRKGFINLQQAIAKGDWDAALKANDMDTSPRERIPDKLWDFLQLLEEVVFSSYYRDVPVSGWCECRSWRDSYADIKFPSSLSRCPFCSGSFKKREYVGGDEDD